MIATIDPITYGMYWTALAICCSEAIAGIIADEGSLVFGGVVSMLAAFFLITGKRD